MTKDSYELLGFIISKATNGLMVYSSVDRGKGQIDMGEIGDAVVKLKNKREYKVFSKEQWLAMPKNAKEAAKSAKKNEPVLNELEEQESDLKVEEDESANSLIMGEIGGGVAMAKNAKETTKTANKKEPNETNQQNSDLKGENDESANSLV